MRVYLDNSTIGRLLDIERSIEPESNMLKEDMAVLPDLLQVCAEKGMELCASDDAGAEIEKLRSSMPQLADSLMAKLQSFTRLPIRHTIRYDDRHHYGMGARYADGNPSNVDLLAQELKAFLLSKTKITRAAKSEAVQWDAYHLAVCKDNGCEIFLTCDYASIWAYRRLLQRLFAIEVRRPVELFNEIKSAVTRLG